MNKSKSKIKAEAAPESPNSPNKVRQSFLKYLRTEFPYKTDWTHPAGHKITHELIKKTLTDYMHMDHLGYKALWYLWTTQGTRAFVAEQLNFSSPTVKRRWDKSVNTVMLMLLFPSLKPDSFVLFNGLTD